MKKSLFSLIAGFLISPLVAMAIIYPASNSLAPNPVNNYYLQTNGSISSWSPVSGGSATTSPAGSNTQIQYNNGGVFGASSGLTFSSSTNLLTITGTSSSAVNVLTLENSNGSLASGEGTEIDFDGNFFGSQIFEGGFIRGISASPAVGALTFGAGELSAGEKMRLLQDGALIIGTSTDNGLGLLQVNGSSTMSQLYLQGLANSPSFLAVNGSGLVIATTTSQFLTSASLSGYLSTTSAAQTYLPLSASTSLAYIPSASSSLFYLATNPSGYITATTTSLTNYVSTSSLTSTLLGYLSTTSAATTYLTLAASTSLPYIPSASSSLFLTAVGITSANGVSGTWSSPNLTISLGDITPTTVNLATIYSDLANDANTALGYAALFNASSTILGVNTAIGMYSLYHNNIGTYNIALGYQALSTNYSGNYNTAIGTNALVLATTSSNEVALGYSAGNYATSTSNELFIDNQDRSTYTGDITKSLIYGQFNSATSSQFLTVNGSLNAYNTALTGTLSVTGTSTLATTTISQLKLADGLANNLLAVDANGNVITTSTTNLLANVMTYGYASSTYLPLASSSLFYLASNPSSYLSTITADSPLSGSGTSGSHLTIQAGSGSQNGYISPTDWNTFNNKLSTSSSQNITNTGTASFATTSISQLSTSYGIVPRVVSYTASTSITINVDTTDVASTTVLYATTTFANPTGTAHDGQMVEIDMWNASTTENIAFGTSFAGSGVFATSSSGYLPLATTTASSTLSEYLFQYKGILSKWIYQGLIQN